MGNIRSIQNALNYIKVESQIIDSAEQILKSEKLILPGVGSFRLAIENINKRGFLDSLNEVALRKKIPILDICLRMQLMAEESEEDGLTKGFEWIKGTVKRFPGADLSIKLLHLGSWIS